MQRVPFYFVNAAPCEASQNKVSTSPSNGRIRLEVMVNSASGDPQYHRVGDIVRRAEYDISQVLQ